MSSTAPSRQSRQPWTAAVLWCVIVLVCVSRIVPFSPDMPLAGLDGSWRIGLEQAMAQGLAVGRDMVFTFGPYAAVYTRSYHPATDNMMLCASLYLALSFAGALGLLVAKRHNGWLAGLLLVMAGLAFFNDTLLFFFPLLVGLHVFLRWGTYAGVPRQTGGTAPWLLVMLFAPFGLLPLIKGTLLVLCVLVAVLSGCYLWVLRQRKLSLICYVVPALALVLFWYVSGQPMSALPLYFGRMLAIMSGYNEAMSSSGVWGESLPFVIAAAALVLAIRSLNQVELRSKIFLLMLFSGYLFISFKAGFVRQDGHVVIASTSLLLAALVLALVFPARATAWAAALVLLPWLIIDHHYMHTTPRSLIQNVSNTVMTAWHGAARRLTQPDWPRSQYDATLMALKQQAALPVLPGTSDIYSYDQALLIASGNHWAPRPVMQSYSAYTPALAEANRVYLLGKTGPDNIFFNVQTIDQRFPSLDDGPSWPVLLGHYRLSARHNEMVIMKRHAGPDNLVQAASHDSQARLGETLVLPAGGPLVFAQFDIRPSLLGRVAALLFRPSKLEITVTLDGGAQKKYRLVSSMAKAGFLLSPLVETGAEFSNLYGAADLLDDKRVTAFSVDTARGFRWFWQSDFVATFKQLKPRQVDTKTEFLSFDKFITQAVQPAPLAGTRCEGVIDRLNERAPTAAPFSARSRLKINGWLTLHTDRQRITEQVYVVLTDSTGNHHAAPAHRGLRPDVAAAFHDAAIEPAGYALNADLSGLEGRYQLNLGYADRKQIYLCPDIGVNGTISHSQAAAN